MKTNRLRTVFFFVVVGMILSGATCIPSVEHVDREIEDNDAQIVQLESKPALTTEEKGELEALKLRQGELVKEREAILESTGSGIEGVFATLGLMLGIPLLPLLGSLAKKVIVKALPKKANA
jgi:hypothetical protein